MAQAVLSWTPPGGANSISQDVQWKNSMGSIWSTFINVGPLVNTATVTGLSTNTAYDFRVINNCTSGGPINSATFQAVILTCPPTIDFTVTSSTVQFSFDHVGGSITSYVVQLYNSAGTSLIDDETITSFVSSPLTGTFTGLTASTVYKVRVIVNLVSITGVTYTKICPFYDATTAAVTSCPSPLSVTATMT